MPFSTILSSSLDQWKTIKFKKIKASDLVGIKVSALSAIVKTVPSNLWVWQREGEDGIGGKKKL